MCVFACVHVCAWVHALNFRAFFPASPRISWVVATPLVGATAVGTFRCILLDRVPPAWKCVEPVNRESKVALISSQLCKKVKTECVNSSKCEKLPTLSPSCFPNSKINEFGGKVFVSLHAVSKCKGALLGRETGRLLDAGRHQSTRIYAVGLLCDWVCRKLTIHNNFSETSAFNFCYLGVKDRFWF